MDVFENDVNWRGIMPLASFMVMVMNFRVP